MQVFKGKIVVEIKIDLLDAKFNSSNTSAQLLDLGFKPGLSH
jgi:hypothetical protein